MCHNVFSSVHYEIYVVWEELSPDYVNSETVNNELREISLPSPFQHLLIARSMLRQNLRVSLTKCLLGIGNGNRHCP